MIIAHGSPVKQWNQPVLDSENHVKQLFDKKKMTKFNETRVALMEFTESLIAYAIKYFIYNLSK